MTHGLIRAGFHVLAGIDNEPRCEPTYVQNTNPDGTHPEYICKNIFPKTKLHPGGQQEEIAARTRELIKEYRQKTGLRRIELVFAICAPCQPFTRITKIEMSESRKFKRTNDANLLLTTLNLIKEFRPSAIICENVEGILENGPDSVLAAFKRRLRRAKYSFDARVVNAARFGIPQHRRRTIGIGFDLERYDESFEVLDADPALQKYVTVAETIGHLPPLAAGERHPKIPNHRARSLSPLNLKRISCAAPGKTNAYLKHTRYGDLSLDCHNRLAKRQGEPSFGDTYTRMHGDDVGPTITTRFVSISNGRFGHFDIKQNRGITPREGALLQTFPSNYVFYPEENMEFTSTLIGNAVPPKLAQFFGDYIRQRLRQ